MHPNYYFNENDYCRCEECQSIDPEEEERDILECLDIKIGFDPETASLETLTELLQQAELEMAHSHSPEQHDRYVDAKDYIETVMELREKTA